MLFFKKGRSLHYLFLALMILPLDLHSQDLFFKNTNIIEQDLGLQINDFVKDDNQILWIGSDDGLLSSDGEDLIRITIKDSAKTSILTLGSPGFTSAQVLWELF